MNCQWHATLMIYILIATKTEEEHDELLEQTLEKLEKAGVKLRQENVNSIIPQNCSILVTILTVWELSN